MEVLYVLENLRFGLLDKVMQFITEFGSETVFLALALVTYWCVDKRQGYYLVTVGFLGTIFNQFLKLLCLVPRPWVKDPSFTVVESARADATGFSFPSGHSQSAVGVFGVVARSTKRGWLRWVSIALMVLVPFSRMYLGVHTPQDVLVGGLSALVLVFALRPVVYSRKKWAFPALMGLMIACGLAYVGYVEFAHFPQEMDAENLAHGVKNAWTLLGAMLAFLLAYGVDEKYLRFEVKAIWWAQVLKVALGLGLTVGLKALLKLPLVALMGDVGYCHGIRYFLVVLFAAMLWPMTFKWFSALGGKDK